MSDGRRADLGRMSPSVPPPGFVPPPSYGSPAPTEPAPAGAATPPSTARGAIRSRSARPRLLAGGLGAVALAVLAFVLFGSGGGSLTDPVAQAATVSSGAAGYNVRGTITASAGGVPLTGSMSGSVDRADHAASMSMAFDLSGTPAAAQALGSDSLQMQMIMLGGDIYMKLPQALMAKLPSLGGKPWLKLDLAKLTGIPGMSGLMRNSTATDPTHVLSLLRAESDSVTNEGNQTVDGIDTTHYRVELDLSRVPANLPAADRAAFRQALSEMKQVGSLPADVWIDAHHLVRRMVIALNIGSATGPALQETITEDIGDYGPQPRITAPPADQVQDMTSLIGAGGGSTIGG
jgi:hypothetical protein